MGYYLMRCLLFLYDSGIPVNIRPIPTQELENSGDIVINLNNAQTYVGDTVSSTYLLYSV